VQKWVDTRELIQIMNVMLVARQLNWSFDASGIVKQPEIRCILLGVYNPTKIIELERTAAFRTACQSRRVVVADGWSEYAGSVVYTCRAATPASLVSGQTSTVLR